MLLPSFYHPIYHRPLYVYRSLRSIDNPKESILRYSKLYRGSKMKIENFKIIFQMKIKMLMLMLIKDKDVD